MSTQIQQTVTDLAKELSDLIQQYEDCVRRDDFFEIKRKILAQIRDIERQIDILDPP